MASSGLVLIERCVHLPIALRIAARRIKAEPHTSLTALIGQLREEHQRLAALSTGDSIYCDIRAVFSWSYTVLSPQAAKLFRLLGLHPGPDINPYAGASLANLPKRETNQLLTELLRASLLEEPAPGRYSLHDLLSAYATGQLSELMEANEVLSGKLAKSPLPSPQTHAQQYASSTWCQAAMKNANSRYRRRHSTANDRLACLATPNP